MTRRWTWTLSLLLLGCTPEADDERNEGIAVGNPGLLSVSLAVTADVDVTRADLDVTTLEFGGCGGYGAEVGGAADLALEPAAFAIDAGRWCGVRLNLGAPLVVEASWGTSAIALTLDADEITVGAAASFDVDEETELAFEIGMPEWLDPVALGMTDGEDLVVGPGDDLHDELVAALHGDSALFDDLDGSGDVGGDERDAGPLALGDVEFTIEQTDAEGAYPNSAGYAGQACACAASVGVGDAGAAVLLLLPLFAVSRRRR